MMTLICNQKLQLLLKLNARKLIKDSNLDCFTFTVMAFYHVFEFYGISFHRCVIQGWPYQSFFRVISKHSKPFDFLKEQFNHIKDFCGVCVGPPKYPSHSSLENIGTSTYHLLLSCIVTFGEDPARIGPIKT